VQQIPTVKSGVFTYKHLSGGQIKGTPSARQPGRPPPRSRRRPRDTRQQVRRSTCGQRLVSRGPLPLAAAASPLPPGGSRASRRLPRAVFPHPAAGGTGRSRRV